MIKLIYVCEYLNIEISVFEVSLKNWEVNSFPERAKIMEYLGILW